jgi:hypothetical protein
MQHPRGLLGGFRRGDDELEILLVGLFGLRSGGFTVLWGEVNRRCGFRLDQ